MFNLFIKYKYEIQEFNYRRKRICTAKTDDEPIRVLEGRNLAKIGQETCRGTGVGTNM